MDPLSLLSTAFKIFGIGKGVHNLSKTIEENSKAKREQRELNKRLNEIRNRSDFQAFMMYLMAGAAGWGFFMATSMVGVVIVSLLFLGHCGIIDEYHRYINVKRELILTTVLGFVLAPCTFGITVLSALWLVFKCRKR